MKPVYEFIQQLAENNNREWFEKHKNEYKDVQLYFNNFVDKLIYEISLWDPEISPNNLTAKNCVYRIYRDIRFSKNKQPYKTHMGAFVCKGGKSAQRSGYYFHVEPEGLDYSPYIGCSMLATGLYCPPPVVIRSLRDEIGVNGDSFLNAMSIAKGFEFNNASSLKKLPKGYEDIEERWKELIKLRDFTLYKKIDKDFLYKPNLLERCAAEFKKTYELNRILNMAVDYAFEEMDDM